MPKPKLSSNNLVEKMKTEKGITFNYITPNKAENYLLNVNNYLRTSSYRKNYTKHEKGVNKGKYINLDFAYLTELATIDMHLRFIIMKMCIDIEHALKVNLIKDIESGSDNGYIFAQTFLNAHPEIIRNIQKTSSSPYTSDLIAKNFTLNSIQLTSGLCKNEIIDFSNCPIWVLVELLSFGDFIKCYDEYYSSLGTQHIPKGVMHLVRSIRNCCAHNNCLINDLNIKNTSSAPQKISLFVSNVPTISRSQMRKKLSSRPILEFTAMLYVYNSVVSKNVSNNRTVELKNLFYNRMKQNSDFFKKNQVLISTYNFTNEIINFYF